MARPRLGGQMFTGVTQGLGRVVELQPGRLGSRGLQVEPPAGLGGLAEGASVSIDGCCLTLVGQPAGRLAFELSGPTLARTTLGQARSGTWVNVERALRVGDPLDGHWVTGHVDGVGHLAACREEPDAFYVDVAARADILALCAPRGSVAVAGVSLTVVAVGPETFTLSLVPHTRQITTLGRLVIDDRVNLEADLMARYVARRLGAGPC